MTAICSYMNKFYVALGASMILKISVRRDSDLFKELNMKEWKLRF